jgi:hypothetical protein
VSVCLDKRVSERNENVDPLKQLTPPLSSSLTCTRNTTSVLHRCRRSLQMFHQQQSNPAKLIIKIRFGSDLRRFTLSEPISFSYLVTILSTLYPHHENFIETYDIKVIFDGDILYAILVLDAWNSILLSLTMD